jgi:uncharacterized protein YmfQ (DUF2313 family)
VRSCHAVLARRLHDPRKAVGPVVATSGDQAHAVAVALQPEPERLTQAHIENLSGMLPALTSQSVQQRSPWSSRKVNEAAGCMPSDVTGLKIDKGKVSLLPRSKQ